MALPRPMKPGDTVEYTCVAGTIHVKVLRRMPNGKLSLDTRSKNTLVKVNKHSTNAVGDKIFLTKNVSVFPDRTKLVKKARR